MVWKQILGFEGKYEVSENATVRSLLQYKCGKYVDRACPKIMTQFLSKAGSYPIVSLRKIVDGKSTMFTKKVHVLFCRAFLPNPENKKFINHKNGIKTDNRIENLEWVTSSENNLHAIRTGLRSPRKGRSPKAMFSDDQVREIRLSVLCAYEICKTYNCSNQTIRKIRSRRYYKDIK